MQGRVVFLFAALAAIALTGCRTGSEGKSASGGSAPPPAPAANHAPTISGTPGTSASVNTAYSFKPTASDPDGDKLTFQVANKPAWASFDSATGRLYGTPSSAAGGTFKNVQITVSDGSAAAALPAFSIVVADAARVASATLNWQPPTQNSDGTPLTNLAGYKVRYGSSAGALTQAVAINNPGVTTYVIDNLSAGTWYFAMSAVSTAGTESNPTAVVSMTIS